MQAQGLAGQQPSARVVDGYPAATPGSFGEIIWSELLPPYYSLVKARAVWIGSAFDLTTITGNASNSAGGSCVVGLFNPQRSAVDLVPLFVTWTIRNPSTTTVASTFAYCVVDQGATAVTGTQTPSINAYDLQKGGSKGRFMSNVALTGSRAQNVVGLGPPMLNITNPVVFMYPPAVDEFQGTIIVGPGGLFCVNADALTISGDYDVTLAWAEVPR